MKAGHVTMQYKWMLGYEKGPDGRPVINEEQAETVRFIYQRYLAGDTLRAIKSKLEALNCTPKVGQESQRKGCRNLWEKNCSVRN